MNSGKTTRRKFIQTTGAAALGSTLAFNIAAPSVGKPLDSNTLKVGLIGCGGRGTGAANQALKADDNVVLSAVADVFEYRVNDSVENLKKEHPDKVKDVKKFVGFEAYQQLIDSDVDVVLLTTPPYFRPLHTEAAVNAGKHIFTEKPMAVDAPGIRRVMASAQKAKEKGLSMVSGLCWRYHIPKRETFAKVLDGAVGNINSVYNTFDTGTLWLRDVQPDWTEMQKKAQNWYYHNWISGDHIVEQGVHSVDMMSWVFGDKPPLSAMGTGGRQVRVEPEYGNIYDHFGIVYEYENGAKGFHFSRQQKDCVNNYGVDILGTDGRCVVDVIRNKHSIKAGKAWKWDYRGDSNDMYQQEHDELFASIRNNTPVNDGKIMTQSTMLAIMGRMVAYTGQKITYDEALNSKEILGPETCSIDTVYEDAPVAKPGITKFI